MATLKFLRITRFRKYVNIGDYKNSVDDIINWVEAEEVEGGFDPNA